LHFIGENHLRRGLGKPIDQRCGVVFADPLDEFVIDLNGWGAATRSDALDSLDRDQPIVCGLSMPDACSFGNRLEDRIATEQVARD
jgi:hypothetical protein